MLDVAPGEEDGGGRRGGEGGEEEELHVSVSMQCWPPPPPPPSGVRLAAETKAAANAAARVAVSGAQDGGLSLPPGAASGDWPEGGEGGADGAAEEGGALGEWEVLPGDAARLQDRQGRWLLLHAGGQVVEWDPHAQAMQQGGDASPWREALLVVHAFGPWLMHVTPRWCM